MLMENSYVASLMPVAKRVMTFIKQGGIMSEKGLWVMVQPQGKYGQTGTQASFLVCVF